MNTRIGLSSACFYPMETLEAVKLCTALGFRSLEIFMNSFSELEEPYLKRLAAHCREVGASVVSLHPFTSGYEYMLFFSAYEKRAAEAAEFYRKYFHAAAYLGADYLVFHGDSLKAPFIGMDTYCEVLSMLMRTAKSEGVTLAHECVSSARGGNPEFIRELHRRFGDGGIRFVFDVKQVVRGGFDPFDMLDAMGSDIVHVHINDFADGECRLPCMGELSLAAILKRLEKSGYGGKYIIEVYRKNFEQPSEISESAARLKKIFPRPDSGAIKMPSAL